MRILVTGGPVHARLDAVKVITNRFKGGLMAELADSLAERGAEVVYLTAKGAKEPSRCAVRYHDGFEEYMGQVLDLAKEFDAVVLGAAVPNLVPDRRWEGKFPSHRYRELEVITVPFRVAPRVVNRVRNAAPQVKLFAFKLLAGADHAELIEAAYQLALDSRATAVVANDLADLDHIWAVTRERSVHPMRRGDLGGFILELANDVYYRTELLPADRADVAAEELQRFWAGERGRAAQLLIERFRDKFVCRYGTEQYVFGTVAVRLSSGRFVTTGRGKRELDDWCVVEGVDHERRVVVSSRRATLNAPLLDRIFRARPDVDAIVHYHDTEPNLPVLPWAPPGTVRDSDRKVSGPFVIDRHGTVRFFRLDGSEPEEVG